MQGFIDDETGQPIKEGRSYQVGIYNGGEPVEARDYVSIDTVLDVIRKALTQPRARPPLQITVHTWEHGRKVPASWEGEHL